MWGNTTAKGRTAHCRECKNLYDVRKVLFRCPHARCAVRDDPPGNPPPAWAGKPIFRPERYAWTVPCPVCKRPSYVKHCPECWAPLPLTPGNNSTIGLVGAAASGKTCYMAGLIRQIKRRLARQDAYQMSLEWDDELGRDYFRRLESDIYVHKNLPEKTQYEEDEAPPPLQLTMRFPVRGFWRKAKHGDQGVISLEMPDRGGELFLQSDPTALSYLENARAIIFVVDPMMSEPYRERHQKAGKDMDEFLEIEDPADTLDAVAKCIRRATQQSKGKLKRQLAVVLTKCDMDGLFDPDADEFRGRFPVQSGEYDPATAADISRQVLNLIHDDLDMPGVVAKAVENFEDVSFFAVSSLGTAPQWVEDDYGGRSLKLVDPRPRRVEEPLLWILHRWGYL